LKRRLRPTKIAAQRDGTAMTERRLDATGLICPLPVLRARKALEALGPGDELVVLATDPAARNDLPAFCATAGHALLERWSEGEVLGFRIRKGG